jgi:hypothetical protein
MMMSMMNINMIHRSIAITISIYNYSVVEIAPKVNTVSIEADTPLFVAFVFVAGTCLSCLYLLERYTGIGYVLY